MFDFVSIIILKKRLAENILIIFCARHPFDFKPKHLIENNILPTTLLRILAQINRVFQIILYHHTYLMNNRKIF